MAWYTSDPAAAGRDAAQSFAKTVFDGKRMRKNIVRRVVDANGTLLKLAENRPLAPLGSDFGGPGDALRGRAVYARRIPPTAAQARQGQTGFATRHVHTSTNKQRCPINCAAWSPEGRRVITGASSGEFTLWNGTAFNFETILQAHESPTRCLVWSHNGLWMVSADNDGIVKYWQDNMNMCREFQAHNEPVRDIAFSPSDQKFASCSDDVTIKLWDFARSQEEKQMVGHGWDVKCLAWHPRQALLASGAKDNLSKLWDVRSGRQIATLHGHKNTIMRLKWNDNGNWLVTAARDQLLKLFDIRMLREVQSFHGHVKDVVSVAWHPFHEDMLVSGSYEGGINFWMVGDERPVASISDAHESSVWGVCWHPAGHLLCSVSHDNTTKFWARDRPGDPLDDKYHAFAQDNEESPSEAAVKAARAAAGLGNVFGPGGKAAAQLGGTDYGYQQHHQQQQQQQYAHQMQQPSSYSSAAYTTNFLAGSGLAASPAGFAPQPAAAATAAWAPTGGPPQPPSVPAPPGFTVESGDQGSLYKQWLAQNGGGNKYPHHGGGGGGGRGRGGRGHSDQNQYHRQQPAYGGGRGGPPQSQSRQPSQWSTGPSSRQQQAPAASSFVAPGSSFGTQAPGSTFGSAVKQQEPSLSSGYHRG